MNLDDILAVLQSDIPSSTKRTTILMIISNDEEAIPDLLKMLKYERERNKELTLEMNMQLSRADMGLKSPSLNEGNFIVKEIKKFYEQYKGRVTHCFKNE